MRLRLSAWAPLLDISNINHGLLLPILLHCVDQQGRPLLGHQGRSPDRGIPAQRPCRHSGRRRGHTPVLDADPLPSRALMLQTWKLMPVTLILGVASACRLLSVPRRALLGDPRSS